MLAAAPPLLGSEPVEEVEGAGTTPAKPLERRFGVTAGILTLLGPPLRIDGQLGTRESPLGRILNPRAGDEHLRLVHRKHGAEAQHSQLLDVAQVAQDLRGRPALGIRPPAQITRAAASNGGGEIRHRSREAVNALSTGETSVLLARGHQGSGAGRSDLPIR